MEKNILVYIRTKTGDRIGGWIDRATYNKLDKPKNEFVWIENKKVLLNQIESFNATEISRKNEVI